MYGETTSTASSIFSVLSAVSVSPGTALAVAFMEYVPAVMPVVFHAKVRVVFVFGAEFVTFCVSMVVLS